MLAMLQKAKGVKQEELNWSGVVPWLRGQTGSVAKADIVAYLKANELHEAALSARARFRVR
jgi:hypothetical protein